MNTVTLHEGDNRETLRRLIVEGVRVHSIVCDPPYGLTSITKRFGADKAAPAKFGTDGAFQRAGAGFMGSKWDGTSIERDPEFWKLVYEILLPGGYCVAFSGSRTGHWQACAMEMAGFTMHPMLGWCFGSGFPKAHNASKAIDRELGAERPVIGVDQRYVGMSDAAKRGMGASWQDEGKVSGFSGDPSQITGPATAAAAAAWEGWAYGGQALKPALEPIYVGQKPFSEKNGALNLLKHGVGAINIDGCRVPATDSTVRTNSAEMGYHGGNLSEEYTTGSDKGRHPANLLLDGSPEVVAMFPTSPGQIAKASSNTETRKTQNVYGEMRRGSDTPSEPRNDSGSAARFFNSFPQNGREGEESADRRYNDAGSTNFAALPGARRDPAASASEYFNTFPPETDPLFYHSKANKADRAGSKHPTVKPIALMRWLVRLVTPPGGTVLDPFAGSGTTGAAAQLEGFDCILMEAEAQFADDIRRRFDMPAKLKPVTTSAFDDLLGGDTPPELEFADLLG